MIITNIETGVSQIINKNLNVSPTIISENEIDKIKYTKDNVIKSINYDQHQILKDIITLFCPDGIECDPTFSKGVYYKDGIKEPKYKFDIAPVRDDIVKSDCRKLPLDDNSIKSLSYDPPFLITATSNAPSIKNPKKGSNIIHNRFSSYYPATSLFEFYKDSLKEFYRVLKDDGILIVKCQDTISGGTQYLSHIFIINEAEKLGFYTKDIFILLAKQRLLSFKGGKQQHSRKYHSYFILFQKNKRKVKYLKIN